MTSCYTPLFEVFSRLFDELREFGDWDTVELAGFKNDLGPIMFLILPTTPSPVRHYATHRDGLDWIIAISQFRDSAYPSVLAPLPIQHLIPVPPAGLVK